jgi:L,D-peptidoglycan transpeptidase YkuD (ErfK/YbiS/YcfS/YnhG family)
MKRVTLDLIRVHRSPRDPRRGVLVAGALVLPCALGRSGVARAKREGDGASPEGCFRLLGGLYRPDRWPRPRSLLPMRALRPDDGWCDDPADRRYNRPLRLPDPARHERLWRDDGLYDVVLDIGWNRGPIRRGRGSAIFLHLARPDLSPTEGCVGVPRAAVRRLVARIGPRTRIAILR